MYDCDFIIFDVLSLNRVANNVSLTGKVKI